MGLATPRGPFPRVITTATELRSPNGCALGPFAAPAPPHATPTEVEVFDADAVAAACKSSRSQDGRVKGKRRCVGCWFRSSRMGQTIVKKREKTNNAGTYVTLASRGGQRGGGTHANLDEKEMTRAFVGSLVHVLRNLCAAKRPARIPNILLPPSLMPGVCNCMRVKHRRAIVEK